MKHINLHVEGSNYGGVQPVEVEQCAEEPNTYRVLYSPGFVEGIAAGDVVRITNEQLGHFEVIKRGGNVSLKWAAPIELGANLEVADSIISSIGARRDGAIAKAAVWTVPVESGFQAIEACMDKINDLIPGSSWWYGNVYDENNNPLNWWI